MMKKHITIFLLLITTLASAKLGTGQWNTHMSYVEGQRLALSSNKVYVVASGSLFSYGLNDNAIETYSKVNGLNDVYINDIAFCDKTSTLVICYENGNIDLMSANGITNVPDLYKKPVYGSKTINRVDITDGMAYISTALGILKLNIEKAEISETYILSSGESNNINGVATLNGKIYAATDNGLYAADLDHINLQDFNAWSLVSTPEGDNIAVKDIITFSDHIIISQYRESDEYYYIYKLESNSQWNNLTQMMAFQSLSGNNDMLTISNAPNLIRFNNSFTQLSNITSYNFSELEYSSQNSPSIIYTIPIDQNTYFIADSKQGLIKYNLSSTTEYYYPKGPATNLIWNINIEQGYVRTVHGQVENTWNFTRTPGAISTYHANNWSFIDNNRGVPAHPQGSDLLSIVTDPLDVNRYYVTSWHKGVLEFYNDQYIQHYNKDLGNSTIQTPTVDPGANRVYGVTFDENHNLWVSNSNVDEKMHVKDDDGNWTSFSPTNVDGATIVGDITFVSKSIRWQTTPYWGKGIIAFNDNETWDDASDDQTKYFSIYANTQSGGSEYVSERVYTIEKDLDGSLWVGCDNGAVIYYNPENSFDDSDIPVASRINIPRNDGTGLSDYLLKKETVQSIAVDGGNRKWLATVNAGVLLVSPDGLETIYHFTKDNSPLLSNNVRVVEIDQESGEVFFGTEAGLISFQADATAGNDNYDNIKIYPNPVRETFQGDITITGLVEETSVKVTDVSGNLVYETSSNGGTATWNGKNFYGERVGTGVYLIFCSDKEGNQSGMTKVMVIN